MVVICAGWIMEEWFDLNKTSSSDFKERSLVKRVDLDGISNQRVDRHLGER